MVTHPFVHTLFNTGHIRMASKGYLMFPLRCYRHSIPLQHIVSIMSWETPSLCPVSILNREGEKWEHNHTVHRLGVGIQLGCSCWMRSLESSRTICFQICFFISIIPDWLGGLCGGGSWYERGCSYCIAVVCSKQPMKQAGWGKQNIGTLKRKILETWALYLDISF